MSRSSCEEPFPVYIRFVHRFFTPLLRRLYGLFAVFLVLYAAFYFGQHTRWNKERLYRRLLSGDHSQKVAAAFDLTWLGGQEQLLHALKSPAASIREISEFRRGLEPARDPLLADGPICRVHRRLQEGRRPERQPFRRLAGNGAL